MSKKKRKAGGAKSGGVPQPDKRVRWTKAAVVAPLLLCVLAAGAASLRWQPVRRAVGLSPLSEPLAQATPTPLFLSKEYVYAGGRLVATEEPTPAFAGPPPTNVVATASSITPPSASVSVTWAAPASGTVTSYVVERASLVGQFSQVGQPVAAPATSFNDASASEGSAYLYRVKAVFSGGGASDYSNTDIATAVAFTDDPLIGANDPQQRPATTIKATHLVELRRAVSAVHALAGLGAVTAWTYPDPVSSPPSSRRPIYIEDVTDLRTRLTEALPRLGITPPSYADLTRNVTKVGEDHFQQLRNAVK